MFLENPPCPHHGIFITEFVLLTKTTNLKLPLFIFRYYMGEMWPNQYCISTPDPLTMERQWPAELKILNSHMQLLRITGSLPFIVSFFKAQFITFWHILTFYFYFFKTIDEPVVVLSFGSNLNPDNLAEGNDVYFECKIKANPEVYKVVWLHDVSCIFHSWPVLILKLLKIWTGKLN